MPLIFVSDAAVTAPMVSAGSPIDATPFLRWCSTNGIAVLIWIIGAVLLARIVRWITDFLTRRIDRRFKTSDDLVRSESVKHRYALVQVVGWLVIALIILVAGYNIISFFNVPAVGLVAPATVLGAAFGFGAQRVMQDLLAGVFVIMERQYGYGDTVILHISGTSEPAEGTVEDVTLRATRLRSLEGEMISVPNGQIVKVVNLSKDWARAVVDIPLPLTVDINQVTQLLHEVGDEFYADARLKTILMDAPTLMGITKMEVNSVTMRMVTRTLPGKQFEASRELRMRIVAALGKAGITVALND